MRRKIIYDCRFSYLNDLFDFTIRVVCCNFLNLYGRYVINTVQVVFNNFLLIDATDRSKISSNQKRLFFAVSQNPLSVFANTSFKDVHTLTQNFFVVIQFACVLGPPYVFLKTQNERYYDLITKIKQKVQ